MTTQARCQVCGHEEFAHGDVLWPELIGAWELQPHEVDQAARKQGLDDLSSVELAVLEPDGTISFLSPSSGNPGETKHKM